MRFRLTLVFQESEGCGWPKARKQSPSCRQSSAYRHAAEMLEAGGGGSRIQDQFSYSSSPLCRCGAVREDGRDIQSPVLQSIVTYDQRKTSAYDSSS